MSEICPKIEKSTENQWLSSGWQDCFSPTTPNSSLKLLRIEPRLEPATNKKSPTTVELFCRGGRIRTYDLHIPNVARYRATLHPEKVSPFFCGTKIGLILILSICFFDLQFKCLIICLIFFYAVHAR